jgi:hypothetical protein
MPRLALAALMLLLAVPPLASSTGSVVFGPGPIAFGPGSQAASCVVQLRTPIQDLGQEWVLRGFTGTINGTAVTADWVIVDLGLPNTFACLPNGTAFDVSGGGAGVVVA